ncbi:enoyl-[acyl-carrier-protein] reductase FabK [Frisingicoccus sp.]|uniref:enoyl-[acyl-carrier-protein] reductase FabK n=1 Tax=Frisingicoccus sp. TaxID=1918627 RepID=UPI003AB7CCCC
MKTAITELLHIEYPIFQGGMAWVAEHTLAAAVSNAGGLGIIASGGAPCEYIREEVHKAKQFTDKPFGVNVMLMNPEAEAIAKMLVEEQVSVVTTGAGNPEKYFPMWKEAEIKIIPVVASVGLARRMAKYGADALVAEGCESGGHIGEQTTMSLVPQVVQAVDIPVLAAGGIGDGRGVAAAFMLGAEGVQVGTRFLLADETRIHENYKEKVAKAKDIDTQVTGRSTGHPVRLLRNPMTRKYLKLEAEGVSAETLELLTLGSLRRAVVDGDLEEGSFMAGQIAGLINKRQTCREIIEEMMDEALTVMLAKADRFK